MVLLLEDMDTDADTEPWVGTVKSIQAQEDDFEEAQSADEAESVTKQVDSGQKEDNSEEESVREETDDAREDVDNNEIVLKLDESEEELIEEDKEEIKQCDVEYVAEKTSVISNTLETESVVSSLIVKVDEKKNVEEEKSEAQDEPDSTTGRVTPVEHQFKTPPRPTRLSVMPPTPPESGQGTPPQQVNVFEDALYNLSTVAFDNSTAVLLLFSLPRRAYKSVLQSIPILFRGLM